MTTTYDVVNKLPLKVQNQICKLADKYVNQGKVERIRTLKKLRSIAKQHNLDLEWLAGEYDG